MKELGLRLNSKKSVLSPLQRTSYLGVTRDNRISCKLFYQWTSKLRSLDSSKERDGATAVNNSETGAEVRIRKHYILTMTTEKKKKKKCISYSMYNDPSLVYIQ